MLEADEAPETEMFLFVDFRSPNKQTVFSAFVSRGGIRAARLQPIQK